MFHENVLHSSEILSSKLKGHVGLIVHVALQTADRRISSQIHTNVSCRSSSSKVVASIRAENHCLCKSGKPSLISAASKAADTVVLIELLAISAERTTEGGRPASVATWSP